MAGSARLTSEVMPSRKTSHVTLNDSLAGQNGNSPLDSDDLSFRGRFKTDNSPNVHRFFYAMRRLGYSNYAAICDIIDNAVDAEATSVHVLIQLVNGQHVITIADNGKGMNLGTLDESLKLGSKTERNVSSDLGCFGMGLVT